MIGRHLMRAALDRFDVVVLTRHAAEAQPPGVRALAWRPDAARSGNEEQLSRLTSALEGAQGLVNLAGASIGDGRLGRAHLRRVIASRVDSTATLVTALRRCRRPPRAMIQASASGIYGRKGDALVTEESDVDPGFVMGEVCRAWEAAAAPAGSRSRLCVTRAGMVVAQDADAFQRMLLPIRLGLGGPLGSGNQWMAWIDADDLARAILFLVEREDLQGVFNASAPAPIRQREMARLAARRLRRPYGFPVPAAALRLALGRLADATVLQSARMVPARLLDAGFTFDTPTAGEALARAIPAPRED